VRTTHLQHSHCFCGDRHTLAALTLLPALCNGSENKFVHGSLQAIPWQDNQFDLVYSHEVLEHIPAADIPAVLSELVRVSKGRLVLTISLRLAGKDDPLGMPVPAHLGRMEPCARCRLSDGRVDCGASASDPALRSWRASSFSRSRSHSLTHFPLSQPRTCTSRSNRDAGGTINLRAAGATPTSTSWASYGAMSAPSTTRTSPGSRTVSLGSLPTFAPSPCSPQKPSANLAECAPPSPRWVVGTFFFSTSPRCVVACL
jgi:hypothetical protein